MNGNLLRQTRRCLREMNADNLIEDCFPYCAFVHMSTLFFHFVDKLDISSSLLCDYVSSQLRFICCLQIEVMNRQSSSISVTSSKPLCQWPSAVPVTAVSLECH
jgi:hypothetical protein